MKKEEFFVNITPFIAASIAANMAARTTNFDEEDNDRKFHDSNRLLLNYQGGEGMTITPNEKIVSVNITQNTESYAPQQRRFEASRRLSDSDKDTVYARTMDDILQELMTKYNAKEFTLMPASTCNSDSGAIVDGWLLIMKCENEN